MSLPYLFNFNPFEFSLFLFTRMNSSHGVPSDSNCVNSATLKSSASAATVLTATGRPLYVADTWNLTPTLPPSYAGANAVKPSRTLPVESVYWVGNPANLKWLY